MESSEFVASFGDYVDARSATVFVGAGLSQSVGYPDWKTLLDPLRLELGIEELEDLPQLAQYFVDGVDDGRARLVAHLIETFAAVGDPQPAAAHRLLAQLPVDEFWTTNYDPLLEAAIEDAHVFVKDDQLAELTEPGKRRVNKMHGSIEAADEIVLTRDEYERYPNTRPRFWRLLQAQFLTKTFLFLGFGFTDPNLELVFQLVRLHASDIPREHFAIMKRPIDPDHEKTVRQQRLFELRLKELRRVGVHVVVVDRYEEIDEILGKLVARCRPPQVMISGSAPSDQERTSVKGSYPTAEIPEALSAVATEIGSRLAATEIAAVAGGELGAVVGYQMMRQLADRGAYHPDRFTLVRRQQDANVSPPNHRLGGILFTGEDPTDLRSSALQKVRALLVLGGGAGVQDEINRALEDGLGVVPVGCTGGTAEKLWQLMHGDLTSHLLGGRLIDAADFDRLMSDDLDEVADAAVRLIAQALFLA
jgi:predicted Rossmann-fold nucleotide-binding protein